jgi:hypothetical protein
MCKCFKSKSYHIQKVLLVPGKYGPPIDHSLWTKFQHSSQISFDLIQVKSFSTLKIWSISTKAPPYSKVSTKFSEYLFDLGEDQRQRQNYGSKFGYFI